MPCPADFRDQRQKDVYAMMKQCWGANPAERPAFADIVHDLGRLGIGQAQDGGYSGEPMEMEVEPTVKSNVVPPKMPANWWFSGSAAEATTRLSQPHLPRGIFLVRASENSAG